MKHGKHIQVSESFLLCALLTMTGGFLDVYTYITRGHVFANAQTGNVVLLGLNLAEGNIKEVAFYLFPIIAFALGILFTEWIRAKFKEYDLLHWRQIVVFFEALLLFFPAFMASGMWDTAAQHPGFLRLRRTSGKLQESQRAQRGDDHVYRQSPQRYRADIPLCPHTRPRYKENHPQLLRNRRLFRARRDAGSRLVRPLR